LLSLIGEPPQRLSRHGSSNGRKLQKKQDGQHQRVWGESRGHRGFSKAFRLTEDLASEGDDMESCQWCGQQYIDDSMLRLHNADGFGLGCEHCFRERVRSKKRHFSKRPKHSNELKQLVFDFEFANEKSPLVGKPTSSKGEFSHVQF
jgi:hypothetical protein